MTDERKRLTIDGAASIDAEPGDIDAVDPEAIAALHDDPTADGTTADDEPLADAGPTPERFAEFVEDVDAGRVAAADGAEENVPIDASMDDLFADR
ncbi:hypothetical protein ACFQDG_05800 [Natronoarchaeum mannanilyticum]|uniref:Uncharacterized protein n=1 Tax=Natronoarchaeum mannanilyticum TaxID=926360 RepID=A0AAV3TAA9_9EURY